MSRLRLARRPRAISPAAPAPNRSSIGGAGTSVGPPGPVPPPDDDEEDEDEEDDDEDDDEELVAPKLDEVEVIPDEVELPPDEVELDDPLDEPPLVVVPKLDDPPTPDELEDEEDDEDDEDDEELDEELLL